MPKMNNQHLLKFEAMDQAIRRMLEPKALVLAYDLRKRKMMSLADANDARDEFDDPEHRLYEWFSPNTYAEFN